MHGLKKFNFSKLKQIQEKTIWMKDLTFMWTKNKRQNEKTEIHLKFVPKMVCNTLQWREIIDLYRMNCDESSKIIKILFRNVDNMCLYTIHSKRPRSNDFCSSPDVIMTDQ